MGPERRNWCCWQIAYTILHTKALLQAELTAALPVRSWHHVLSQISLSINPLNKNWAGSIKLFKLRWWNYGSTTVFWLVVQPPLWKILVNWDDEIPNINGNIKNGNQTTNQFFKLCLTCLKLISVHPPPVRCSSAPSQTSRATPWPWHIGAWPWNSPWMQMRPHQLRDRFLPSDHDVMDICLSELKWTKKKSIIHHISMGPI